MRYVLLCAASIAIAFVGFYRASLLVGRKRLLDAFMAALSQLDLIIGYEALPLSAAAKRLSQGGTPLSLFWSEFSGALSSARDVESAWHGAMIAAKAKSTALCALDSQDEAILSEFAASLGKSDAFTQSKNVELAIERLRPLARQAGEQAQKRGKLMRSLGVLCGLAVFIMLM